jgi:hypothetical protein
MGPGEPRDVLAMLHQERDDPPEWVLRDPAARHPGDASGDVTALSLFAGIAPPYELMGVELHTWEYHERRSRLVVGGRYRLRPRGTWEVVTLPFLHIWSFAGDEVETVYDYISGIELRRRCAENVRRRNADGLFGRITRRRRHHAA